MANDSNQYGTYGISEAILLVVPSTDGTIEGHGPSMDGVATSAMNASLHHGQLEQRFLGLSLLRRNPLRCAAG